MFVFEFVDQGPLVPATMAARCREKALCCRGLSLIVAQLRREANPILKRKPPFPSLWISHRDEMRAVRCPRLWKESRASLSLLAPLGAGS